jgi:hypothetical protein
LPAVAEIAAAEHVLGIAQVRAAPELRQCIQRIAERRRREDGELVLRNGRNRRLRNEPGPRDARAGDGYFFDFLRVNRSTGHRQHERGSSGVTREHGTVGGLNDVRYSFR